MEHSERKFIAADLVPGQTYQVIKSFVDYDGIAHLVGERWRFLKKSFLPYEDGLSLFIESDGRTIQLRLQWRPETQGQTIDNFSDFAAET